VRYETTVLVAGGRIIDIDVTFSPLRNNKGEIVNIVGFGVDITERKQLEHDILEVAVREQERIGRDLHDGLGQHLAAVACLVKRLEQQLAAGSLPEAGTAAEIGQLVNEAVKQTHTLAALLFPIKIKANGLSLALGELASDISMHFQISCSLEQDQPVMIEDGLAATHLYRIAQEAAHNAIKHGKAKNVKITLAVDADTIRLIVKDDGMGIAPDWSQTKGMGLRTMAYRVNSIGASLNIHRAAEGGTVVQCVLRNSTTPIKNTSDKEQETTSNEHQEPRSILTA
jgi:signal transduction histidine kinase